MTALRKVLAAPPAALDRDRLLILARSGVELRHLEWAFGRPRSVLEAMLADADGDRRRPANDDEPARADRDRPARRPPIEAALEALARRAAETASGFVLDGAPVAAAALVAAAIAAGADIAYPGIRPLPEAFRTGPSILGRRKRRAAPARV